MSYTSIIFRKDRVLTYYEISRFVNSIEKITMMMDDYSGLPRGPGLPFLHRQVQPSSVFHLGQPDVPRPKLVEPSPCLRELAGLHNVSIGSRRRGDENIKIIH